MWLTATVLLGCATPASTLCDVTPMAALVQRQSARLQKFYDTLDASRYHVQVLFVDDDAVRARTCEAMLERVAIWSDAGWWIYPNSASIDRSVEEGGTTAAMLPSLQRSFAEWDLCSSRLKAPSTILDEDDLANGAYDLILCVDALVFDEVIAAVRACGGAESSVLGPTDFLAYVRTRI